MSKAKSNKAKKNANSWIKKNVSSDKQALTIIMVIISILLPPLAVFLTVGLEFHFWLNIILTLCGGIPGVIHAIYVVLTEK